MAILKDTVITGGLNVTDGVQTPTLNLGNAKMFYGTCDTAAATVAKVVVCPEFTATDLAVGTMIWVKFSATNSGAVASITLNVNGTGAKNIKRIYNGAINNLATAAELLLNIPHLFCYNGTYWVVISGIDYNSAYSSMSAAEAQAGTASSNRVIQARYLLSGIKRNACFKVVISNITSLPVTKTVTGLVATHEVISSQLSNPSAQSGDWTVTTATGSLTVSGTFVGSTPTDLILFMGNPESAVVS